MKTIITSDMISDFLECHFPKGKKKTKDQVERGQAILILAQFCAHEILKKKGCHQKTQEYAEKDKTKRG